MNWWCPYFVLPLSDIDECLRNLSFCHPLATCFDTEGNYTCPCNQGYTGDGFNNCDSKLTIKGYLLSHTHHLICSCKLQTLTSAPSTWTTVTAMLTVLTLLGASTVPVCLVTLELDSSVVSYCYRTKYSIANHYLNLV